MAIILTGRTEFDPPTSVTQTLAEVLATVADPVPRPAWGEYDYSPAALAQLRLYRATIRRAERHRSPRSQARRRDQRATLEDRAVAARERWAAERLSRAITAIED